MKPFWKRQRGRLCASLMLVGLLCSANVWAQDGEDAVRDRRQRAIKAKKAFEQGAALYNEKKYSAAIVEFQRGQRVYPSGIFLYNIAMCHMRLGNMDDAREYAERSLEIDKRPLQPNIESKARGLSLGSQAVMFAISRTNAIAAADENVREQAREQADVAASQVTGGAIEVARPFDKESDARFGWLGWTGVTGAVLGTGALVTTGLLARQIDSDFDTLRSLRTGPSETAFEQKQDEIADKQRTARVLGVSGAVLAAAGAGLIVADLVSGGGSAERRRQVGLAPNGLNGMSFILRW